MSHVPFRESSVPRVTVPETMARPGSGLSLPTVPVAVLGPLLVTTIVKVTVSPSEGAALSTVLETSRSTMGSVMMKGSDAAGVISPEVASKRYSPGSSMWRSSKVATPSRGNTTVVPSRIWNSNSTMLAAEGGRDTISSRFTTMIPFKVI